MDDPDRSSPPYQLPTEDEEYLDWFGGQYGSTWHRKAEGPDNCKWGLFIENFPIPPGYNRDRSTLMVLIPTGYPGAGLDMFYFDPPLARADGRKIGALAAEAHFGTNWQRWSRHFHLFKWKPGEDSIVGYIEYVREELETEASR